MAEFVTLFCLVRGDTTNHAFSVKIDRSGTVDELKELIKAKDPDSFGNVNAKLLSVWKVSLPIDTITPSLFAVLGQELLPTEEIGELYPENPPKKAVHIIVDAPGKKGTPKKDKLCFSKHKNLEAVLAKFGITGSSIRPVPDFHPKRISIDDDNFDFLHCVNDLKVSYSVNACYLDTSLTDIFESFRRKCGALAFPEKSKRSTGNLYRRSSLLRFYWYPKRTWKRRDQSRAMMFGGASITPCSKEKSLSAPLRLRIVICWKAF